MKIAIISDTHGNAPNFEKAIDWIKKQKINFLIHCGDIGLPSMLEEIIKGFSGEMHLVFGNLEDQYRITKTVYESGRENVILHGELGEIEIDNKKIGFCHFPEFANGLVHTGDYDLVFYGHTHKPWEEKIGECRLVNPGNLCGFPYKSTFAVYDTKTDKLELKILEKLRV